MAPSVDESNPLAALGPVAWDTVERDQLDDFLDDTFACAQLIADSIPATATSSSAYMGNAGRPRSHTDGAVSYGRSGNNGAVPTNPTDPTASDSTGKGSAALSLEEKAALIAPEEHEMAKKQEKIRHDLRQSWKEVHTSGANPRGVIVYKMNGGRDGYAGSSWFARRSLHRVEKAKPTTDRGKDSKTAGQDVAIGFDMFRRGLLREFSIQGEEDGGGGESTKANDIAVKGTAKGKTSDATSTVRTMITKKRLEHIVVESNGNGDTKDAATNKTPLSTRQLDVYLLEAIFPGPTAARDFVTMLLTAQAPCSSPDSSSSTASGEHGLRQFMLVSKPCQHPDTPNRQGYVRAQYESVEMIREVRVPVVPSAKTGKIASAANNSTRKTQSSIDLSHGHLDDSDAHVDFDDDTHETAIEWLMITRNNPGGSVPRFLVDKSTPSSIISDANKFMDWLVAQEVEAMAQRDDVSETSEKPENEPATTAAPAAAPATAVGRTTPVAKAPVEHTIPEEDEEDAPKTDESVQRNTSLSPPVTILSMDSSGGAASSAKLFNMLTGALGGAVPAVASKLPNPFGGAVEVLNSSFEGQQRDLDDDEDTGGETYSDIDEEDAPGDDLVRGRSRRSASEGPQTQDVAASNDVKASAPSIRSVDSAAAASIPPPPPTTALGILAHSRAVALGRLNDPTSAGQSTGASSLASNTDTENDTETGSHNAASRKKEAEHAAAKAAKVAKAAEAAQKRHEKELKKLQDRQRKAEEDLLKASNKRKPKEDTNAAESIEGVGKTEPAVVMPANGEKSAQSLHEQAGADNSSSTSSLSTAEATAAHTSTDPATRTEIQKLREKHEKAVARQEAQYQKEIEKLERKRQQQAEKDAARLRKQEERETKANTAKQLAHARAERDVARKETEMLTERVRQLEARNNLLTAELEKLKGEASASSVEAGV
ncbi:hypothetical protein SCUCBS95973_008745 [Sporothrix curviconia]|uniref:DUF3074 domain-containing protein n=1 Tax=Sporothrix curviconia TaxID=1260050 RepID=A0ABP0CP71_9PEZI